MPISGKRRDISVAEQYYRRLYPSKLHGAEIFARGRAAVSAGSSTLISPPVCIKRTKIGFVTTEMINLRLSDVVDAALRAESFRKYDDEISGLQMGRKDCAETAQKGTVEVWLQPTGGGDLKYLSAREFYDLVHGQTLENALNQIEICRRDERLRSDKVPEILLAHIREFPGDGANLIERNSWGLQFLDLAFSDACDVIGQWGVEELAWLITHPLAEIIRRPLISKFHFEALKNQIPPMFVDALLDALFAYASDMNYPTSFHGKQGRKMVKALDTATAKARTEDIDAFVVALQKQIRAQRTLVDPVLEKIGGVTNAKTEIYHAFAACLTSIRDCVSIERDMTKNLRQTLKKIKLWVIEDEELCVERFMDCNDIANHHPGRILRAITENQYELLIVNVLIPGSEGGIHFIRELREKADKEEWRQWPKIIVMSCSTRTYETELEGLKGAGIISDYVNKADYDPSEFDTLVKGLFPEKFK